MDKINTLSTGEKLVVGGGVLMLVASFLAWYSISYNIQGINIASVSRNGWQSPGMIWSFLAILISVALAGSIVAVKFGNMALPNMGKYTMGQAYLAGAGVVVVCLILKLLSHSSNLSIGFFLAIIAAVVIGAGGYLLYTEEKTGAMS